MWPFNNTKPNIDYWQCKPLTVICAKCGVLICKGYEKTVHTQITEAYNFSGETVTYCLHCKPPYDSVDIIADVSGVIKETYFSIKPQCEIEVTKDGKPVLKSEGRIKKSA